MIGLRPQSVTLAAESSDLVDAVVRFCRLLRSWGVHLPASASSVALKALQEIDLGQRRDFRSALRVAVIQRPEDFELFDYLFNVYWKLDRGQPQVEQDVASRPVNTQRLGRDVESETRPPEKGGFRQVHRTVGSKVAEGEGEIRLDRAAQTGASRPRSDLGSSAESRAELERLARALSAQLAARPSRRFASARRGRRIDLRATLRSSLRHGGIPIELRRRERKVTRSRLVLFVDVSRSMDEYASLFLEFAAAVLRRAWRVEVFLFASELSRVTELWMDRSWDELRELVPDCGGGTRFGDCLDELLDDYASSHLASSTIVIVLSDGLDAGDPERVASSMERLGRLSRGVIWLNPLLAVPGYEPRAQGMAAALPYIDVFAAAHDLPSLWRVITAIRDMAAQPAGAAPHRSLHDASTFAGTFDRTGFVSSP